MDVVWDMIREWIPVKMPLTILDLQETEGDLATLEAFHRGIYVAGFPDPDERESLENMCAYLRLRSSGWYGQNNYHILLVKDDEQIVGGAVCDYLAEPNVGIIEFLLVAPSYRGGGIGRRLHDAIQHALQGDAKRAGAGPLAGIAIEMNDPFRVDLSSDSMEPFDRAAIWGNWGYSALQFPYVQPALSPDQSAVNYLLLCLKPLIPSWQNELPASIVGQIVHGYLKWAMRIDVPEQDPTFRAMSQFLSGKASIGLKSLNDFIGRNRELPFDIVSVVSDRDVTFPELMAVYARSFPEGQTAIPNQAFSRTLSRIGTGRPGLQYHLWGVRPSPGTAIAGFASFYTLSRIGFGGYVALEPPLRGTGRCALLVARIEEQMVRDQPGLRGWYIECDQGSTAERVFRRLGFRPVSAQYLQPSLNIFDQAITADSYGPNLSLMYKPISAEFTFQAINDDNLVADVCEIVKNVYCIDPPESSMTVQSLRGTELSD